MIFHEYNIKFIVPSIQSEPNMETWFAHLQELFAFKDEMLNGVKFGRDTDYTKEMTIVVTMKPIPLPELPSPPEKQIENLKKNIK